MGSPLHWYLQRDGKASGPFSAEDLRDQVRQGLLLGHDLVFQEGSEQWKRAFDWPELASEIFSEERTSFTRLFTLPRSGSAPPEDWIVLLRFEEADGLRFKQQGPYSTEQVRELLQSGQMKPSDHLWRKGYAAWVAVYMEPDFSPSLWNVKNDSVPLMRAVVEAPAPAPANVANPESARLIPIDVKAEVPDWKPEAHVESKVEKPALVSAITVPTLPKAVLPPEMPEGPADFEDHDLSDAVTASGIITAPKNLSGQVFPPQEVTGSVKVEAGSVEQTSSFSMNQSNSFRLPPQPRKARKWAYAVPLVLALAVGVGYYKKESLLPSGGRLWTLNSSDAPGVDDVLSGEDESSSQVNPVPPVAVPPVAAVVQTPSPAPVEAKPEEIVMVKQGPTIWSFSLPVLNKNPLVVMITGYSGRILQVQALNLRINVDAPAGGRLDLNPADHNLPEGEYFVQIFQSGKLLVRDQKSTIEDAEKFARKILVHRKQIAFDQQQEKRALLKSVDRMQAFVTKYRAELAGKSINAKSKKALQKDFEGMARAEMKTVRQSRHALMYPSGWSSVAQQYESVRGAVAGAGSRRPASKVEIENYRKKLSQLRGQVSQMSLSGN